MIKFLILLCLLAWPAVAQTEIDTAAVKRGEYLMKLGDCTACHSTPNLPPLAGGLPMQSPIGIIYTTNITPDKQHGIGNYSLQDFMRVMRQGIARGGQHLYPAMPYASYRNLSDADIADMYAYFMRGVTPSDYAPPKTRLWFPFNQRWGMAIWNFLFVPRTSFKNNSDHGDVWNRGAYLVKGLGHCGACHTPRGIFYDEKAYDETNPVFLGGNPIDDWHAADLRSNPASGLGRWSDADLASFLKTGHGGGATAFGGMQQVVEDSTQYFTAADIDSVVQNIKSIAAHGETAAYNPNDTRKKSDVYAAEHPGAGLYMGLCTRCHLPSGVGQAPLIPALAGNPVVMAKDPISLIHIVLEGGQTPQTEHGTVARMPGFATLTDREIGEVVSYIRVSWGNQATPISTGDVTAFRHTLVHNNNAKQRASAKAQRQLIN